jgi:galactitol-specific phosphotransferase system IIB component
MPKNKLIVIAVSGFGAVNSLMIANKIKDILSDLQVDVEVIEMLPTSIEAYLKGEDADFIVTTNPIPGDIKLPAIAGSALMTGIGEEEVVGRIRSTAQKIIAQG